MNGPGILFARIRVCLLAYSFGLLFRHRTFKQHLIFHFRVKTNLDKNFFFWNGKKMGVNVMLFLSLVVCFSSFVCLFVFVSFDSLRLVLPVTV